ncbi:hypothetical protein VNO80_04895 [Phaseolus coccineus]|uniref:Uncharacterized protein n=1 Tax=Phaseolus coccineus TaxID=3886 RepID=A0AAN9NVP8_PHACN
MAIGNAFTACALLKLIVAVAKGINHNAFPRQSRSQDLSLLLTCQSLIGSHSHQPTTLKRTTITHGSQPHPIIQRKKEKSSQKRPLQPFLFFLFPFGSPSRDSATRHNHHAHPSDSIILGLHKFRNGFFAEVQASTKKQPFRFWVFSMLLL